MTIIEDELNLSEVELNDLLYDEDDSDSNEELDLVLDPSPTYFGIIVEEAEKEKNEIYAGSEIWLNSADYAYIATKKQIDIVGDELGIETEVEFKSLSDFIKYLKLNNIKDCHWDLDNLAKCIV